jgi:transcriptional regulator with XRE-family HTH domain
MLDGLGFMPCATYPRGPILRVYVATIGENIKRLRTELGMQQGDLATQIGVPQSQLSRWETDFSVPDTTSLLKLAPALSATIDQIVAGVDQAYDAVVSLRAENVHRDLSGQTRTGLSPSTSHTEGDVQHGKAEDRARSVEPREAQLRQTLLDIASQILNQLGDELVDDDRRTAGTPLSETQLRRRDRNAGS